MWQLLHHHLRGTLGVTGAGGWGAGRQAVWVTLMLSGMKESCFEGL